jgi:ribose 1,5-bisphosphokinase
MDQRLYYIIGASGAGKDSLIRWVRARVEGSLPILFAHRYITRPAGQDPENHICLSQAEFLLRREKGLFALSWESHGLYYGIGREIEEWMAKGFRVVVNGSREYLPVATGRYPGLVSILIEARPDILQQRLETRGREQGQDLESRLKRQPFWQEPAEGLLRVTNNGLLEDAGRALKDILTQGLQEEVKGPERTEMIGENGDDWKELR